MIWAELRGKLAVSAGLSVAERWEDVLTSSVFGVLRYLPDEILLSCLGTARTLEGKRLELPSDGDCRMEFWPMRLGWSREPDVVLEIRKRGSGSLTHLVVIEVKYRSGKSQKAPALVLDDHVPMEPASASGDQLADLLCDAHQQAAAAGARVAVVYLTAHIVMPHTDLIESVNQAQARMLGPVAKEIYWLGWSTVDRMLAEWSGIRTTDQRHERALEDLRALMRRRGLGVFCTAWSVAVGGSAWRFSGTEPSHRVSAWGWVTWTPSPSARWTFRSAPARKRWFADEVAAVAGQKWRFALDGHG